MFIKKTHLKLLAEKPDTFGRIPPEIVSPDRIEELREIPKLAVADITGRYSWSALMRNLAAARPNAVLPSIVYTGTEYGNWGMLDKQVRVLKKKIEKELNMYVTAPVVLGAPRFWNALNGAASRNGHKRFGSINACCGCMLYACAVLVPLCKTVQADMVVSDRGLPAGRCSGVDPGLVMKYCGVLLSSFGISLKDTLHNTVPAPDARPVEQIMYCVLEQNGDNAMLDTKKAADYFELFAIPAVAKIIGRKLAGDDVDYEKIVAETYTAL